MLKSLKLDGIGPVQNLHAEFGERLNVLTGDNGLGKSFLLDVCFWTLTGTWPGARTALPDPDSKTNTPRITFEVTGKTKSPLSKTASFDFHSQTWDRPPGRPTMPGLVVYASVDGGFSVWDPARNYYRVPSSGRKGDFEQPRAYQFSSETLASGLLDEQRTLCSGLIADWVTWFYGRSTHGSDSPFAHLETVVTALSHPDEPMSCATPVRVFTDDSREFPALRTPYGVVPFPHWSAGVRRMISFAYLLVWTWHFHRQAAKLRKENPTHRLILIVDEIEEHLHPKWQRTILPAIMAVAESLQPQIHVQIFAATHSPLVLASLEPGFDTKTDKLFWLNFNQGKVEFQDYPWAIQGDVVGWLTSEIFGLQQARSKEAEEAIEAAEAFLRGELKDLPAGLKTKTQIQAGLEKVLPGIDPFWPRWVVETEQ